MGTAMIFSKVSDLAVGAVLIILVGLTLPVASWAVLIDRGGGLIYDSSQEITWLRDANYCATDPDDVACYAAGADFSGLMGWSDANDWAANLVFGGFDDWRLPVTLQPDPSCVLGPADGVDCTGSEMGHLFNVDGVTSATPGLFTNVAPFSYWSASKLTGSSDVARSFNFLLGTQDVASVATNTQLAWAVRNGDVPAVSEPTTLALLGLAIVGFGFRRRRR